MEFGYSTPRIHAGIEGVEWAIRNSKNLVKANMVDGQNLTGCVNRAIRVTRFTALTGLKGTPFQLHHGRKPRTELANIIEVGKTYSSDWSDFSSEQHSGGTGHSRREAIIGTTETTEKENVGATGNNGAILSNSYKKPQQKISREKVPK